MIAYLTTMECAVVRGSARKFAGPAIFCRPRDVIASGGPGNPRPGWTLPPDNHWATGYEWIISLAGQRQLGMRYGQQMISALGL